MSRDQRVILFSIIILIELMMPAYFANNVTRPTDHFKTAQSEEFKLYQGGSLDKIRVVKYQSLQSALDALQAGDADLLGQPVPAANYSDIDGYSNIKKQWVYDTTTYLLTINALSYPLNNYHLRRAIAYGINKTKIANNAFHNTADPIDLLVPKCNMLSRADTGLFYDSEIYQATKELAAAGMLDVDEDGMVEAPNGADFTLTLLYPADVPNINETASIISADLLSIGLNNTVIPTNKTFLQSELDTHTLSYDLAIYQKNLSYYDINWTVRAFRSENINEIGENIANIDDSYIDSATEDFLNNQYLQQADAKAETVLTTLRDRAPVIPLVNAKWLTVYTDQNLVGWVNDTANGAFGVWNPVRVTPKSGKTNEMVVAVLPDFFTTFFTSLNPFRANNPIDDYHWIVHGYFNPYLLVFDTALAITPSGIAVPRASTSWDVEYLGIVADLSKYQSRIVFYTDSLANWTDGQPMNAQDYRFTFDYYANWTLLNYSSIINTFKVVGDYQIGITLGNKDIYLYRLFGSLPLLPEHIWEGKNPHVWEPSVNDLVGSGPFKVDSFTVNQSLVLTRNTEYYPSVDNDAPVLQSITIDPEDPIPAESVLVRAVINDRSRISNVTLQYIYSIGKLNFTDKLEMVLGAQGYEAVIPARVTADRIEFSIVATDIWGNSAIIYSGSYSRNTTSATDGQEEFLLIIGAIALIVIVGAIIVKRH